MAQRKAAVNPLDARIKHEPSLMLPGAVKPPPRTQLRPGTGSTPKFRRIPKLASPVVASPAQRQNHHHHTPGRSPRGGASTARTHGHHHGDSHHGGASTARQRGLFDRSPSDEDSSLSPGRDDHDDYRHSPALGQQPPPSSQSKYLDMDGYNAQHEHEYDPNTFATPKKFVATEKWNAVAEALSSLHLNAELALQDFAGAEEGEAIRAVRQDLISQTENRLVNPSDLLDDALNGMEQCLGVELRIDDDEVEVPLLIENDRSGRTRILTESKVRDTEESAPEIGIVAPSPSGSSPLTPMPKGTKQPPALKKKKITLDSPRSGPASPSSRTGPFTPRAGSRAASAAGSPRGSRRNTSAYPGLSGTIQFHDLDEDSSAPDALNGLLPAGALNVAGLPSSAASRLPGEKPPMSDIEQRTVWAQIMEAQASIQTIMSTVGSNRVAKTVARPAETIPQLFAGVRTLCKNATVALHNATCLLNETALPKPEADTNLQFRQKKLSLSADLDMSSRSMNQPKQTHAADANEFLVTVALDRPRSMQVDCSQETLETIKSLFRSLVCSTVVRCGGRMVREAAHGLTFMCSFSSPVEALSWERGIQQYTMFLPWPAEVLDVSYMAEKEGVPTQLNSSPFTSPKIQSGQEDDFDESTRRKGRQAKEKHDGVTMDTTVMAFAAHVKLAVAKFRDSVDGNHLRVDGDFETSVNISTGTEGTTYRLPSLDSMRGRKICARGPRVCSSIHYASIINEVRKARFTANPAIVISNALVGIACGGQTVLSTSAKEECASVFELLGGNIRGVKLNAKATHPELLSLVGLGETHINMLNWNIIPSRDELYSNQPRHREFEPNWWLMTIPSFAERANQLGYLKAPLSTVTSRGTKIEEGDSAELDSSVKRRRSTTVHLNNTTSSLQLPGNSGSSTAVGRRRSSAAKRRQSKVSPGILSSGASRSSPDHRATSRESASLSSPVQFVKSPPLPNTPVETNEVGCGTRASIPMVGMTKWGLQSVQRMYRWVDHEIDENTVLRELFLALGLESAQDQSFKVAESEGVEISYDWDTLHCHYESLIEQRRGVMFRDDENTLKAAIVGHFIAVRQVMMELQAHQRYRRASAQAIQLANHPTGAPAGTVTPPLVPFPPPHLAVEGRQHSDRLPSPALGSTRAKDKRASMVRVLLEDATNDGTGPPVPLLPTDGASVAAYAAQGSPEGSRRVSTAAASPSTTTPTTSAPKVEYRQAAF